MVARSAPEADQAGRQMPGPSVDLPKLADGDEEVALVDRRYPEAGDQEARRAALERALEYFSSDRRTAFRLETRLALVDWNEGRMREAHERLSAILGGSDGLIDSEIYSWAQVLDGRLLGELQRVPDAVALLERVARDRTLPVGRRSAAATAAADLIARKSPADAAALLREIESLPGGATPEMESRIINLNLYGQWKDLLASKAFSPWYTPGSGNANGKLSDYQNAIEEAIRQGSPTRCFRLSLLALAAHGPEGDFPRRLWEAASFADWIERKDGNAIDPAVCTSLLDLCDLLPAGQTYFIEGKFLRAKRCARAGDRSAEQAVLNELLTTPSLPSNYLAPTCKMLGSSLEATGRFNAAIETYRLAESAADRYSAGADCLLHAVFIDLEKGNDADAIRLIGILGHIPDEIIRGTAAPGQIRELVATVRTGREQAFWQAGRVWWPDWIRFAKEIDSSANSGEQTVPEIASLPNLLASLEQAHRAKDARVYFRLYGALLSAARWQPSLGSEAAAIGPAAADLAPDRRDEFRGLLIRMLRAPHPPEIANLRERQLFLAMNLFNARQTGEVLRLAAAFAADPQPDDEITRAIHRIHALAALDAGLDYGPCAASLERDLASQSAGVQRAMAVGLLADLYHRLGRDPDARQLLQRENGNPAIAADSEGRASLVARLDRLSGRPASAARPALEDSVGRWIRSVGLTWYGYAEPASLDDPRVQNLDETLQSPEKIFQPADQIKLLLLIAQDRRRPEAQRQKSFQEAVRRILTAAPDTKRMSELAASVIDNPDFDMECRMRTLWSALATLSVEGRRGDYEEWRKNALCAQFNADFQKKLALLDLEAELDRTSSAAILQAADKMARGELSWMGVEAMGDLLGFLIRLGDVRSAEALAAGLPNWKLGPDAAPSGPQVQLDFARRVRLAKAMNPVHEAMAASLAARFPQSPDQLPPEYRELRMASRLPSRAPGAEFQACRYLVKTRQFERSDLVFWGTLVGALPRDSHTASVVADLLRAGLGAAPDDQTRSELIVLFFTSADTDDPAVRRAIEGEFAPYRRTVECPLCYLVIRLYEINRDLRLGNPVPLSTAFSELNDPRAQVVRERASLRHYIQVHDRAALRKTVEEIDSARLLSPSFLVESLRAFKLLGIDSELRIARDVAGRTVREDVLASWALYDEPAGNSALDLALALGDPAYLPVTWVAETGSRPGDPIFKGRVRLVSAYLESDWDRVEKSAADLNREYPTRYSFYWYRGLALHKLGRDRESAEALLIYTQHARDEPEYAEAIQLLKSLGN
jgi:hypothetical protein